MKKEPLIKTEGKITGVITTGGYYIWSWKFPFRHFVEEKMYIATENEIHEWENFIPKEEQQ